MSDSSIDAWLLNYLSWWGVPTFFGASMIRSYPIWKLVLWGSPTAVVTVPPNGTSILDRGPYVWHQPAIDVYTGNSEFLPGTSAASVIWVMVLYRVPWSMKLA